MAVQKFDCGAVSTLARHVASVVDNFNVSLPVLVTALSNSKLVLFARFTA